MRNDQLACPHWLHAPLLGLMMFLFCIQSALAADHVSVQGGEILNCFAWKYTDVTSRLDQIKAANFSAVQVSSVQPLPATGCFSGRKFTNYEHTDIPDWYRLCAPLDLRMITANDAEANTPLGTREEFDAMVTACHQAGIGVVVAVEANQVFDAKSQTSFGNVPEDLLKLTRGDYNSNGIGREKASDGTYKDIDFNSDNFDNSPFNDPTRRQFTRRTINAGVLDLNTEDATVISKMESFLQSLYDAGVDGVYWYHAKYIGLGFGTQYFNTVYDMEANTDYKASDAENYDVAADSKDATAIRNVTFWRQMWIKNLCLGSGKSSESDVINTATDRAASGISKGLFFYGNFNLDPYFKGEKFTGGEGAPTIDHDPNFVKNSINDKIDYRAFREYTKYMNVVDGWFAKSAMMQDGVTWASGNWIAVQGDQKYSKGMRAALDGFYAAMPEDMVYIAEDENTYLDNPEVMYEPMLPTNDMHENRPTNGYLADVVDRSYASMAGQYGSTIVYFARPTSNVSELKIGSDYDGTGVTYPALYFVDENDWTKADDGTFKSGVMHAYVFNGQSGQVWGWPGTSDGFYKVGEVGGHNVVMWQSKLKSKPANIIFNNGYSGDGNQTNDLKYIEEASYGMNTINYWCYFEDTQDWTGAAGTDPDMTKIAAYCYGEDLEGNKITGDYPNNYGTGTTNFTYIGDHDGHHVFVYKAPNDKPVPNIIFNNNPQKGDDGNWKEPGEKKAQEIRGTFTVGMYMTGNTDGAAVLTGDAVPASVKKTDGTETSITKISKDVAKEEPASQHFTADVISKVNKFHHDFVGEPSFKESAYNSDGTESNISAITRQDGAILVMRSPASKSESEHTMVNPSQMLDYGTNKNAQNRAEYKDVVTDNIFTVTKNNIAGKIGPTGVAVLRNGLSNDDPDVQVYPKTGSSTDGELTVTLTPINGITYQYLISYGRRKRYHWDDASSKLVPNYSASSDKPQSFKIKFSDFGSTGYSVTVTVNVYKVVDGERQKKAIKTAKYVLINKDNTSGTYRFHLLYIRLPEVAKGRMNIYAWNDEDGQLNPLTKGGGDQLATYQEHESEYIRPVKNIYEVDKNPTSSGDADEQYLAFVGGDLNEDNPSQSGWDIPYRCDYGMSWNDVYDMGGNEMNRYTIGIPNSRMISTWFRLSYNKKSGYTQLLDAIWCDDDMYLNVAEDKQGNLAVGKMYGIIGDALYNNSTWNYTTPQAEEYAAPGDTRNEETKKDLEDNWKISEPEGWADGSVVENTFWDHWTPKTSGETRLTYTGTDGRTHLYPHVTLMNYEPDETQEAVKNAEGYSVEVSSYTGEFINGKTFRFGYPFDFQHNLVPVTADDTEEIEEWKTNLGIDITKEGSQWKGFLKDVVSHYYQHNYIRAKANLGDYYMYRGKFAEKVTDANGNTCDNITWTLPSGMYTVRLYAYTVNENDNYYYYTISRPTLEYDTNDENNEDVKRSTPMDYENDSKIGAYYTARVHMGNPGYKGSQTNINNNLREGTVDKFHPDRYKLEYGIGTGSETNSDFPETGTYKVVYRVGHGNAPIDPTAEASAHKTDADTESEANYYLGWTVKNYPADNVGVTKGEGADESTESNFGGYWKSYSDGLARKKPAGVHAYYATAVKYNGRNDDGAMRVAVYLKEYKGSVLPANTGFILHFPEMPASTDDFYTRMCFDQDKDESGNVTKNWLFLQADPTSETTKTTFFDPIKTNYLVPFFAYDDKVTEHSADTEWKESPSMKRPDADYDNYWLGYIIPPGGTTKQLGFYRIGKISKGWEKHDCFLSLPRNPETGTGEGESDITFGAKEADIIFGWDPDVPTDINYVNFQEEDSSKPAPYYDLMGRKVDNPKHGVFIHRGKKVVIK